MLRMPLIALAIISITMVLIPAQLLSVLLGLPLQRSIPTAYHRMICALIGVRTRVIGTRTAEHPLLIVANHTSWLDICVISAIAPAVFIAKREVASWPLFGLLAKLQRSIFVDRQRRHKTGEVNAEIARRLIGGDPVVLFAEGTSNDGNRVLPFRSALIGAAGDVLAENQHANRMFIQPLSIAYIGLQGIPMGRIGRPTAAWYGDLDLLPHLKAIIQRGAIDVIVAWGEPIAYDGTEDRKAIAKLLETKVRQLTIASLRGQAISPTQAPGHSFLRQKPVDSLPNRAARITNRVFEPPELSGTAVQPERH